MPATPCTPPGIGIVKDFVTEVPAIIPGDESRPMTARPIAPTKDAPAAVSAFLRGVQRRATLLARLQCGDPRRGAAAVADASRRFADLVGDRPMEQWPVRYWNLLLADPALRGTARSPVWSRDLAWLGNLSNGVRATVLLRLVAGLDVDAIAEVLRVPLATAHQALRAALPRDEGGHHDAAAWQARQAALRAELDASRPSAAAPPEIPPSRPRSGRPWLWAGVGACALALAATFLPFRAPPEAGAEGSPLPPSQAPTVAIDEDMLLLTHPDLDQLADAGDAALVRDLGLYGWYAAQAGDVAPMQSSTAAMPEPPARQLEARERWLRALPASQRTALRARIDAWDALPPGERARLREHWAAWRAMPMDRQALVRAAARRFASLPADEQRAAREEFAAQATSVRRGWLLGPVLGAEWAGLEPLLMQVPASEREPLLAVLHAMPATQLRDLAILSQRTPPQARAELRGGLVRTPAAERRAWLQSRLRQ